MNTALDRQLKRNVCAILCGLIVTSLACAADDHPAVKTNAQLTNKTTHTGAKTVRAVATPSATPASYAHFQYKLSEHDLDEIIAKNRAIANENDSSQFEAVVVTSPTELVPMHSSTREVWGGLAAPFWAMAHPTQAWRILLPIPPE
jgi:hypothetical protein